jgi:DNA-binding GntR family transcriptional regulator
VVEHDPEGAALAMRRHLRNVFQSIERIAAGHQEFFEGAARTAAP